MRLTQPARLLYAAEFSETRSSPVEASRYPEIMRNKIVKLNGFVEFGFQNGLKRFDQFFWKSCPFLKPNSAKLVEDAKFLGQ